MTANQVIAEADSLYPNKYGEDQKLSWLSDIDGKIFKEVILTHEFDNRKHLHHPCEEKPSLPVYDSADCELIIPAPYGKDVYVFYLEAMMAAHNFETQKYNQAITLFNSRLQEWTDSYNREHMPKNRSRFWW